MWMWRRNFYFYFIGISVVVWIKFPFLPFPLSSNMCGYHPVRFVPVPHVVRYTDCVFTFSLGIEGFISDLLELHGDLLP
jgi:hypothetical protein